MYVLAVLVAHIWLVKFVRNQPVFTLQPTLRTTNFNVYYFCFTPSPICF